jgi:hypothetical protein
MLLGTGYAVVQAQGDLDAFMREVLAKRDDNWKKLRQYVLDERETLELRGPSRAALWGEKREYTWYIRDGFFVRSPLTVNGASVGDADRRKYEAAFLQREQRREQQANDEPVERAPAATPSTGQAPRDLDGLILKYTFDDLGWNFFPAQWLVRVANVTASMTMGQAFPDVWLPKGLQTDVALTLALGPVNFHYALDYHDYRQPDGVDPGRAGHLARASRRHECRLGPRVVSR